MSPFIFHLIFCLLLLLSYTIRFIFQSAVYPTTTGRQNLFLYCCLNTEESCRQCRKESINNIQNEDLNLKQFQFKCLSAGPSPLISVGPELDLINYHSSQGLTGSLQRKKKSSDPLIIHLPYILSTMDWQKNKQIVNGNKNL